MPTVIVRPNLTSSSNATCYCRPTPFINSVNFEGGVRPSKATELTKPDEIWHRRLEGVLYRLTVNFALYSQ